MSARALRSLSRSIFWIPTGKRQRTLAKEASVSGIGLHSGASSRVRLLPAMAGEGRYFISRDAKTKTRVQATVGNCVDSVLSTALSNGGVQVHTVEHLLSALEALGVDNCRIEIDGGNEIPLLDGSSKGWVELVQSAGLCIATDDEGLERERLVPKLLEPMHLHRDDSFIVAVPSTETCISCGIDFPKVPAIGSQWLSFTMNEDKYTKEIAPSRTFCIYEEVQKLLNAGLIKGGSSENAIVCSIKDGWLNPPLRFHDEPCRHKILDMIGDFSLLAESGNQGVPIAHILAYKAGHSLHTAFVRCLLEDMNFE
ncbi:UDP-3-O-acyl-N-acetylglucosamine deacetylase [Rhynchospora pubera]|uniref:UDP-3-O-acyl-N-acetylglucosamine deacetylase n=1 Tax=Rhynchospora pubera TaxID=906938 RepID=A0AAV8HLF4_9POAL|nr:UDP-3-O-acyl-N-acetylglucosamine deacetylase [Rhynchospora pubera]